jgi:DNA helicase HerA-like ATPase
MESAASFGEQQGPVGTVLSVRGSEAQVGLPAPWPAQTARATVGKFLAIAAGQSALIGMITEVSADRSEANGGGTRAVANVSLIGEIVSDGGRQVFHRGVSDYPAIGDEARLVGPEQLRLIYAPQGRDAINIGTINHDGSIAAMVDLENLISKHFAILGSTGVGKSSGVAVILDAIMRTRSELRIFLLDGHNEYGEVFGARAHVISPTTLKLPFWLFNFEEVLDVIYGGRSSVPDEVDILAELIPLARASYAQTRASDRLAIKRQDPRKAGYTVDTPLPYLLQDLLALIDDRMGKLENRSSRMNYHRLLARLEAIKNDSRYAFMFENASVGGDTMVQLLTQLFRLEPDGKPISIMQLAGLPVEVVDAVVCVLCRLAFDFGLWSEGAMPLLFVCEEAHQYASADRSVGFAPTRRALARIAKEGRKYGVYLGLVTQRPAELDPTIISQCSTLFAMRMSNDRDQALLRSAVADATSNLLEFVPSLGTGEVVGLGEGMPVPARFTFRRLEAAAIPHSESGSAQPRDEMEGAQRSFVTAVVDRWRNASKGADITPAEASTSAAASGGREISRLLDDARMQILNR